MLPAAYYAVSTDYQGNYKRDSKETRSSRKRGDFDDTIWRGIAIIHASVWGLSTLLFLFAFFGVFERLYASYIEHGISNLNVIVHIGTILALTVDGARQSDVQSFLEMALYAMLFGLGFYFIELMEGMGAIRHLYPEYPHGDIVLLPSILYMLGVIDHLEHKNVRKMREELSEPVVSDPSQEDDIIIDDFVLRFH